MKGNNMHFTINVVVSGELDKVSSNKNASRVIIHCFNVNQQFLITYIILGKELEIMKSVRHLRKLLKNVCSRQM